ncbi:MAG: BON domain-containing protein [Terriglobales bacterium]
MPYRAAAVLAAVLGFAGAGWSQTASTAVARPMVPAQGNTALTGAIMQRLTDDPLLGSITITANVGADNAVSLNGVVPAQALADRALALIQSVPGVGSVTSQILVNQDPFAPPPPQSHAPAPPINTVPAPPRAAAEPQAQISDAFARQPDLARVSARVYGDELMLFGTVTSEKAKKLAEQVARPFAPKLPVNNIIWVDPHPLSPPPLVPKLGAGAAGVQR